MTGDTSWNVKRPQYSKLQEKLSADVVVIGGGITGVVTTYMLTKAGYHVVLLEKDAIGSFSTMATTAMITQYIDTDTQTLIEKYGKRVAKDVWKSGGWAIDEIERIVKEEKLSADFMRCKYYIYALEKAERELLEAEQKSAKQIGIEIKYTKGAPQGIDDAFGYLTIINQAKFHPIKYITQLAGKASNDGAKIYENSEVLEMEENEERVIVRTKNGVVNANWAVASTYIPFNHPKEFLLKHARYGSYMIEAEVEQGRFEEALYQDVMSPYHYFRIERGSKKDTIIIGGEDHRADLPHDRKKQLKKLEKYLSDITDGEYAITKSWSGPIMETIDGLPYIGPLRGNDHVLYAAGFSGNGMTYSHIAAKIFTDNIQGKRNEWAHTYDATRIPSIPQLMEKGIAYIQVNWGGLVKEN